MQFAASKWSTAVLRDESLHYRTRQVLVAFQPFIERSGTLSEPPDEILRKMELPDEASEHLPRAMDSCWVQESGDGDIKAVLQSD